MMHSDLPKIQRCEGLKGKFIFVRTSLNVPVQDGKVANDFRIQKSLNTISFLRQQGAKVILCSHMGRGAQETLAPVYAYLKELMPVSFSPEVTGPATTVLRNELKDGDVLLLENVRQDEREEENDPAFAQELASLADIFVNDDFAASHRNHASLHAICSFLPSYIGINFELECEHLLKVMKPISPALFVLGGAKFETKMPLVEKYLDLYDHVFIGGALANDFFKARGFEIGTSLVSDISLAGDPLVDHEKILLPLDVTAVKGDQKRIVSPDQVQSDESIRDVGPQTIKMLEEHIKNAQTILWNGPMGNYENGYQEQTLACARLIAQSNAFSVVGGGDTVASIEALHLSGAFGFLSTAGGAMLTFLESGTLPALEALKESVRD